MSLILFIFVPRTSGFFGHVVGETEVSGRSNYLVSVNHGHPVTHAYFLPAYLLMHAQKLNLREGRGIKRMFQCLLQFFRKLGGMYGEGKAHTLITRARY